MNKSDVVFNCSTNVIGGGIQNSVNFISQVLKNKGYGLKWFFLLSPQVYEQIKEILPQGSFFIAYDSPASSLLARNKIKKIVDSVSPKLVYTSAGPAYIKFSVPHIMGCSNPYILGASQYAYNLCGNKKEQIKRKLKTAYQRINIKKANVWIVQTESSKVQLQNIVGKKSEIHIVYNSVSEDFLNFLNQRNIATDYVENLSSEPVCKILVPTAYYKHKDLERVPVAAALLRKRYSGKFKITFTVGSDTDYHNIVEIAKNHGVEDLIDNIGAYSHSQALSIYSKYDVVLQPSALEVFSTSYIEAMSMLRPLVVPDFDFAKSICGNYAYYYSANDINSYVEALYNAIHDMNLGERYHKAVQIVRKYGSQEHRVNKIVALIKEYLVNNERQHVQK
ncbi:glycosyl transferase, group 1 [Cronobacter universalis NCTC 9529]|uniref:Glycosyl transferases group 1 n=2 Tax=Cronobacter universalis TaxID=535744 RepID=K8DNC0_9ENTR|nr:glycosyltransferase [Cronobacter universalis]AFI81987.1 WeoX [Cronobacter universalis NCTC 9529]ELY3758001.1 glycosyltransferase [Cronobacter universalis]CCK15067.1 glycosyl transferase, group 1 [Cronobacter universalis NCTC 9529]STD11268.1 Glycosyl transferases group 1 [Cronobacter universalis NCTC 9529]